jgi:hypothetical protein
MTYNSTTGVTSAYINGSLVGTASTTAGSTIDWGTHGAWTVLGASNSNDTMNGMIDDFRVESTVRSAAYIQAQYVNGRI